MDEVANELIRKGLTPYIIPGGGSNPIGALGYVDCALEIITQANQENIVIDTIVHATGSAGTQAGLVVGAKAMNSNIPILGIGVNVEKKLQEDKVYQLACETSEYMGLPGIINREDVVANCDYVGEGYGISTRSMNEAIIMLARYEGLLFDPVYSGKGLAGMIDLIKKDYFEGQKNIVFIHTGGSAGLFAYHDILKTQ
jgi:L-cysteate sulfo-lyase